MLVLLCALPLSVALYFLVRSLLELVPVPRLAQRAVLITGCDSGFGQELAVRCVRQGMLVFAACLTGQGVQSLQSSVRQQGLSLEKMVAFEMDIRSDQSVAGALELVRGTLGKGRGLHALVNNAGVVGNVCWDDWLSPQDYDDVWKVNTLGTIRVTQTFKQLVKRERHSRIVVVSSSCARVAFPALGPYSVVGPLAACSHRPVQVSKFAVEAYCDTIRAELLLFGVKVSILEPGFFRTPLTNLERNMAMVDRVWERVPDPVKREWGPALHQFSRTLLQNLLNPARMNPRTELVVDAYWHAISAAWPRRRYPVGWDARWLFVPFSWLPAELQDLCFQLVRVVKRPPMPDNFQQSLIK